MTAGRATAARTRLILFGLAEIVTSVRPAFFGLTTAETIASTITGVALGAI